MLVGLSLSWGLTWPAMKIALLGIPPFTMRAASALIGAIFLFAMARLARRSIAISGTKTWLHLLVVTIFNIVLFSICGAFAQLSANTGRVAIIVYTMPIWASVMAWFALGERLNRATAIALALCCIGLAVLIYPLAQHGVPTGLLLAFGASVSWGAGTVYVKWAQIKLDALALAVWQLTLGCVIMGVCSTVFEPPFDPSRVALDSWLGMAFSGLFGSGIAYFLWFNVIRMLPAMTASLGALASPVIGVVSSAIILHEYPTNADIVGFTLIFASSVVVLLRPQPPSKVIPEHP
jgi:drug/metabolite transporter (DMT)-like permease